MARSTLLELCNEIRSMCMFTEADYTVGTMNFWDNDQVQAILELNRIDINRQELIKIPKHVGGGSIEYWEYHSGLNFLEQTDGGTAIFIIEDGTGTDIGTANWSADYRRGVITFTADQGGTTYYLTARRYDVFATAAMAARKTANYYATSFDVTTDGHSLKRSQLRQQFLQMAEQFEMNSEVQTWDFTVE